MAGFFRLVFLMMFVFIVPFVYGAGNEFNLQCELRDGCSSGQVALFSVDAYNGTKDNGGSHVGNTASYTKVLCCSSESAFTAELKSPITGDCDSANRETKVLQLTNYTNAHIFPSDSDISSNPDRLSLCLKANEGVIVCDFESSGSCGSDFTSLGYITGDNSHYFAPDQNPGSGLNLCCMHTTSGGAPETEFISETEISGESYTITLGDTRSIPVELYNPSSDVQVIDVYLESTNEKFKNWMWFSGHKYDNEYNHLTLTLAPGERKQVLVDTFGGIEGVYDIILTSEPGSLAARDPNKIYDSKIVYVENPNRTGVFSSAPGLSNIGVVSLIVLGGAVLLFGL